MLVDLFTSLHSVCKELGRVPGCLLSKWPPASTTPRGSLCQLRQPVDSQETPGPAMTPGRFFSWDASCDDSWDASCDDSWGLSSL